MLRLCRVLEFMPHRRPEQEASARQAHLQEQDGHGEEHNAAVHAGVQEELRPAILPELDVRAMRRHPPGDVQAGNLHHAL